MSTAILSADVTRPVVRKVSRLRWMVRLYLICEGVAAVAIALGAAFWLALAVDWLFEPSATVRVVLWAIVGIAVAAVAYHYLFNRALVRLSGENLALLLERRYRGFRDSLITTIEAIDGQRPAQFEQALLDETGRQAVARVRGVSLWGVFRPRPLVQKAALAASMIASITAFGLFQQDAFGFWVERMRLSPELWPRRVQLQVLGFDELDGVRTARVARDDDFELEVLASIQDDHVAPAKVEIRYRLADGRRGRDAMIRVGEALPGRDAAERYRYRFKSVVSSLDFDVIGGDDRVRNLRLEVVNRPAINGAVLACTFPAYLDMAPHSKEVGGRVAVPAGTSGRCRVRANKNLAEVRVRDAEAQFDLPNVIDSDAADSFYFDLPNLLEDRVLMITMRDVDGVENRDPYRIVVAVTPDEPPDVSVQLRGIGAAVTSRAVIPLVGRISDEYGIEELWYEYQVDQQEPAQRRLPLMQVGQLEIRDVERLDLADSDAATGRRFVDVKPGQKLSLLLSARDAYDLDDVPHVGSSQRFLLDVVTPSELRALLERQELGLRQRFEAIYDKMVGTRELLDRIAPASGETDEATQTRQQERARARISGARQNTTQLAFETLGVAEGFDQIVDELVNNRVATEELKERLEQGIAEPLKHVGNSLMPKLEAALEQLQSVQAAAPGEIVEPLARAQNEADAVIEAMKEVLDRMLELESYNELVELLRTIVDEQEKLNERTKAEQKSKLRNLLGD